MRDVFYRSFLRARQLIGKQGKERRDIGVLAGGCGEALCLPARERKACGEKEKFVKYKSFFRDRERCIAFGEMYLTEGVVYRAELISLADLLGESVVHRLAC